MFSGTQLDKKTACHELHIFKILKGKKVEDLPRLERIIKEYGINCRHLDNKVIKEQIHLAMNLRTLKQLFVQHKEQFMDIFRAGDSLFANNPLLNLVRPEHFIYNIYNDPFWQLNPTPAEVQELTKIGTAPVAKPEPVAPEPTNEPELQEITREDFTPALIQVYCKTCRDTFTNAKGCNHTANENKVYRVRLYAAGKTVRIQLKARHKSTAIKEAELLHYNLQHGKPLNISGITEQPSADNKAVIYLHEAVEAYIKDKTNASNSVYKSSFKLTAEYTGEIKTKLRRLVELYKKLNHPIAPVTLLNDASVCEQVVKLMKKFKGRNGTINNTTYNNYIGCWTSFVIWLNKNYKLQITNNFESVVRLPDTKPPQAISDEQFAELIEWLKNDPQFEKQKRIYKKDVEWLRPTYQLQKLLPIAVRRKDIINVKWSDVFVKDGILWIRMLNHKRTLNKKDGENYYIYQWVTNDVLKVLKELGYGKPQNADDYLIYGESVQRKVIKSKGSGLRRIVTRAGLAKKLTNSFPIFTKACFGVALLNNQIRKANITDMSVNGGAAIDLIHSSRKVSEDYYIEDYKKSRLLAMRDKKRVKAA